MSGCRITRNLRVGGSGSSDKAADPAVTKEFNDKLAAMLAEREKQDKNNIVIALTEEEYAAKYGKADAAADKNIDGTLAAMLAEREKQDKNLALSTLTEEEYTAKYGKQPSGKDTKTQ